MRCVQIFGNSARERAVSSVWRSRLEKTSQAESSTPSWNRRLRDIDDLPRQDRGKRMQPRSLNTLLWSFSFHRFGLTLWQDSADRDEA